MVAPGATEAGNMANEGVERSAPIPIFREFEEVSEPRKRKRRKESRRESRRDEWDTLPRRSPSPPLRQLDTPHLETTGKDPGSAQTQAMQLGPGPSLSSMPDSPDMQAFRNLADDIDSLELPGSSRLSRRLRAVARSMGYYSSHTRDEMLTDSESTLSDASTVYRYAVWGYAAGGRTTVRTNRPYAHPLGALARGPRSSGPKRPKGSSKWWSSLVSSLSRGLCFR